MVNEEQLVRFVFANQLLFCALFGALGGLVNCIDVNQSFDIKSISSKMLVSGSAGILLFFVTYDFEKMTPSLRIAGAIVSGFYGSAIFRKLANLYMNRAGSIFGGGDKATAANLNIDAPADKPKEEVIVDEERKS